MGWFFLTQLDGVRGGGRPSLTLRRLLLGVGVAIAMPVYLVCCVRLAFPRSQGVPSPTGPIDLRGIASIVLPIGDGRVVWVRDKEEIDALERASGDAGREFDDTAGMSAFKNLPFKTIYFLNSLDEVEFELMWYYPLSLDVLRGVPAEVIQQRGERRMIAADGKLGELLHEMVLTHPLHWLEIRDLRPGDTQQSVRSKVLQAGKRPTLIFWMYAPGEGGVPDGRPYYSAGILTLSATAGGSNP